MQSAGHVKHRIMGFKMEEFDNEILLRRAKRTWPWTLREEIKAIGRSLNSGLGWSIWNATNEIYRNGGLKLYLSIWRPRVVEPVGIKLTLRECFHLRKIRRMQLKLIKLHNLKKLGDILK